MSKISNLLKNVQKMIFIELRKNLNIIASFQIMKLGNAYLPSRCLQGYKIGFTIVEVKAIDQVGLLHLLAKTISKCGFNIEFARIATEQVV